MIVMINGAFGAGKTTAAEGLLKRLPDSLLYDPEEVGQMLRKIGAGPVGDFQHDPLWPGLVVEVGVRLYNEYQRPMIVPMTLAHIPYFAEIKSGLAALTPDFHHFCLTASTATIHRRLIERGDVSKMGASHSDAAPPGSWAFDQTARCVAAHQDPIFSEQIDTEDKDARQIQDYILTQL